MDISEFSARTISGEDQPLGDYAGKVLLVVNVASQCGFTPQYTGLEILWRSYQDRGFAVLGFPCNQFGSQEPGNEEEIRNFCTTRYDVSFPLFAKVEVNGPKTAPLFKSLKVAAPGLLGSQTIKWNFTKFLVDRDGRVVKRYGSMETPASIAKDIEALL